MEPNNPFRCFDRRYFTELLIMGAALIGLALLGKRFVDGTAAKIAIAIAETLLIGLVLARVLLQTRKLDELGRHIHLVAIAIAFGLTAFVTTAIEFLSGAGVPLPSVGPWLLSFMMFAWALGVAVIARRYR